MAVQALVKIINAHISHNTQPSIYGVGWVSKTTPYIDKDQINDKAQFQMTTEVRHGDPSKPRWKKSEDAMQFCMDNTKCMYLALIGRGNDTRMIGFCKLNLEDMVNKLEIKPKEDRFLSLTIYSSSSSSGNSRGGPFVGTLRLSFSYEYITVRTQSVPVASRHTYMARSSSDEQQLLHFQGTLLPSPFPGSGYQNRDHRHHPHQQQQIIHPRPSHQQSHSNQHHGYYEPWAAAAPTYYPGHHQHQHVHGHHHHYYSDNASSGTDDGNETSTSSPNNITDSETEEEERERKQRKWKSMLYQGALDTLKVAGFIIPFI